MTQSQMIREVPFRTMKRYGHEKQFSSSVSFITHNAVPDDSRGAVSRLQGAAARVRGGGGGAPLASRCARRTHTEQGRTEQGRFRALNQQSEYKSIIKLIK